MEAQRLRWRNKGGGRAEEGRIRGRKKEKRKRR
jgi:hypothetical protein